MPDQDRDNQELRAELEELRIRLEEAEETLRAISEGEVDAVVVSGPRGDQVYALSASLQEHMHFLQTMLDAIPNPVFYKGVDRLFMGCNQAYADYLGRPKEEIVGKTLEDLYPPDLATRYTQSDLELLDRPGVHVGEYPTIHANGSRRLVLAHKTTFTNVDGTVAGILGVLLDITERKQAEEALAASAQKWRTTFDAISDAICLMDNNHKILQCNQAMMDLLGKPVDEIIGGTCWQLVHGAAGPVEGCPILRMKKTMRPETLVLPMGDRWLEVSVYPVLDEVGGLVATVHIISDITAAKQAEEALRRSKDELEDRVAERTEALQRANLEIAHRALELEQRHREVTLLGQMSELLQSCRTIQEVYQVIGRSLGKLFAADSGALLVFSAAGNLLEAVAAWGEKPLKDQIFAPDDCWAVRLGRTHLAVDADADLRCRHVAEGREASLCVPLAGQGQALGVLHLLTEAHEAPALEAKQQLAISVADRVGLALANFRLQETLRHLSVRDPLTGLFNRRYLEESLELEVRRALRQGAALGVMMLDLDYFKDFNDTFGHEAGDLLLREVGAVLQQHVRGSDIACRYGGEEFTLLLRDTGQDAALRRAEELRVAVKNLNLQHHRQSLGTITISAGVALFPEHGATVSALMQAADAALYRAKDAGRDRVCLAGGAVAVGS